ncbi:MAG: SsrA-binding protein [Bdellovibrionaceae bacterium]|nr:SsrA-binding protein [Pseudobdellovibrionaceae bacterium]|tara:strand:+ start:4373 stop:4858 length:486 start_codon:yes stop_codon:yes gene_type:complete
MPKDSSGIKIIAKNPLAYQNFIIEEKLEAGIALLGTEIKSLRQQSPNLRDSYVHFSKKGERIEAILENAHIPHYSHGNLNNHDPMRKRKLLLNKRELNRLYGALTQKGMTIVPTQIYLKNGRAKVQIGVGKGKKRHDKRETLKQKTADMEMAKAMKRRGRS